MKTRLVSAIVAAGLAFTATASHVHYQRARKSPEWFTRGVVYQIQPRAFTPEGTLKAAAAKLPYLKDLGVTIAYLVPVFKMDTDMDRSFWSPRRNITLRNSCGKTGLTGFATSPSRPVVGPYRLVMAGGSSRTARPTMPPPRWRLSITLATPQGAVGELLQ